MLIVGVPEYVNNVPVTEAVDDLDAVSLLVAVLDAVVVIVFDAVCDFELVDERVSVALLEPVRLIEAVTVGVRVLGPDTVDNDDGVPELVFVNVPDPVILAV
jgi:hypothetical protein